MLLRTGTAPVSTVAGRVSHRVRKRDHSRVPSVEVIYAGSPPSIPAAPPRASSCAPASDGGAATALVDALLSATRRLGTWDRPAPHGVGGGTNLVAFSGGVDSSLVAALVHGVSRSAPFRNDGHAAVAALGVGPALGAAQRSFAAEVAGHIGIDLVEVHTEEGTDQGYVANEGTACYHCKTHLYGALSAISLHATSIGGGGDVVMFNGTNADDASDPTRVGLIAAAEFRVASPLASIDKSLVRDASRHLGLPNWDHASSPCLRSRLAIGVKATKEHLLRVERAEGFVRESLGLGPGVDMRVRMLARGRAAVELDGETLRRGGERALEEAGLGEALGEMGFGGGHVVREFKSGSVNADAMKKTYTTPVRNDSDITQVMAM